MFSEVYPQAFGEAVSSLYTDRSSDIKMGAADLVSRAADCAVDIPGLLTILGGNNGSTTGMWACARLRSVFRYLNATVP